MSIALDKQRLDRHFSLHAHDYDRVTPVQAAMGEQLLQGCRQRLITAQPVRRILELGCGTGRLTACLRAAWPAAQITAVDLSTAMLELARQRHGDDPATSWLHADAERLPAFAAPFDLVISNAMIQWLQDADGALRSYAALAAPGALLAFSGFTRGTFSELREAFSLAERELGRPAVERVMPLLDAAAWHATAGCIWPQLEAPTDVVTSRHLSLRAFLRSLKLTGATLAGQATPPPVDRQLYERLHRIYSHRFGDGGGSVTVSWHRLFLYARQPG